MTIDKSELRVLAAALGTPLTEPELQEAQVALDTDGDGTVRALLLVKRSLTTLSAPVCSQVDFEELVAFWLADETQGGVSQEVQDAVAAIAADVEAANAQAASASGSDAQQAAAETVEL